MSDLDKLILKHLRKPSQYAISDEEWELRVHDSLDFGCDWLEHLQDWNPLPASSVEELCGRMEAAERTEANQKIQVEVLEDMIREKKAEISRLEKELEIQADVAAKAILHRAEAVRRAEEAEKALEDLRSHLH